MRRAYPAQSAFKCTSLRLTFAVLAVLAVLGLTACQGGDNPVGPPGDAGADGGERGMLDAAQPSEQAVADAAVAASGDATQMGDTDAGEPGSAACDTAPAGTDAGHSLLQPSLVLRYFVALQDGDHVRAGQVTLSAVKAVAGGWAEANGQMLSAMAEPALYGAIGNVYGGDATNFAVPDLRGRVPVGVGASEGLSAWSAGQTAGAQSTQLSIAQMPAHSHSVPGGMTGVVGEGASHPTIQPSLALYYGIRRTGVFPSRNSATSGDMIARVVPFAGGVLPAAFTETRGQLLTIASLSALYSIIGYRHGGDGQVNFGLPDLQARVVCHHGAGPGLIERGLGEAWGAETTELEQDHLAAHTHGLGSGGSASSSGDGGGHADAQPSLALKYLVHLTGPFPSGASLQEDFLGEVAIFAGSFAPQGWAEVNGQLLVIGEHEALFSLMGTTYGGDGKTSFALPDLRGRAPMHQGTGAGLTPRALGELLGSDDANPGELPTHAHSIPDKLTSVLCAKD